MLPKHKLVSVSRLGAAVAAFAVLAIARLPATPQYARTNHLFQGPTGVFHSFRIPALVHGSGNILIAFAEAHVGNNTDWTEINLVYKRSTDNGATWGALQTLAGETAGGWTNPTAVYEPSWDAAHPKGRIHVFFCYHGPEETGLDTLAPGDIRVYYSRSDDDGLTWAARVNLTNSLKLVENGVQLSFDAVGPGIGIRRVQTPGHVGQLVVPALSRNFYSNDHGVTWAMQRAPLNTANPLNTNEGTVVEALDGALLRNDRPKGAVFDVPANQRRWISYGTIEGGFPAFVPQDSLLDPKCEGSILRYNFNAPDRVLFLNSSSTVSRGRMKVRISYDDGLTWPVDRWLYSGTPPDNYASVSAAQAAGRGGYSSMIKLTSSTYGIGALVEVNENGDTSNASDHRSIDFHRFNIEWILNGATE